MANIKVAVRIRPISERELNMTGADLVVHTDGNEVSLTNLKVSASKAGDSRKRTRRYGFDYCFNSSSIDSEAHATQEKVYEKLGKSAIDALFSGFNACLVAYGQSASGKTYTMMGPRTDPGLTPRICEGLFLRIFEEEKKGEYYETAVSYLEIYNERVRDLLKPSTNSSGLRVREHPRLGPYVQGLTRHTVSTLGSLMSYVEEGTRARKTASTSQNPTSSRSHALLTVSLTSRSENSSNTASASATTNGGLEKKQNVTGQRGARLHLVDLAGSERAGNSNYGLHRLKEGANINKSLVALGNVISALAERGATGSGPGRRFIPYRDSALTWLLKDALGGNATTIMLATISPASGSYNETAHTLRFAQRAQSVVNRPVVNENPVARVIRELRAEISRLTSLLYEKGVNGEDKSPCCCNRGQEEIDELSTPKEEEDEDVIVSTKEEKSDLNHLTSVDNNPSSLDGSLSTLTFQRRCNSDESLSSKRLLIEENESHSPQRSGSLRSLDSSSEEAVHYSKEYDSAKLSSVSYDRVNALALVDIPTLVAVLIKPDDSQSISTQIEEISNENILESSVENDMSESGKTLEYSSLISEKNNPQTLIITPVDDRRREEEKENCILKETPFPEDNKKLSLNSKESKRFGSSESFDCIKKTEGNELVQRSYATLPLERSRQLNPTKSKRAWSSRGPTWTSPKKLEPVEKEALKKTSQDIERPQESKKQKIRNPLRKQDSDSPKRKINPGNSKEEPTPKLVRKGSVNSEITSRTQTPIQRTNRRAEIVAAVTERLYSTKKSPEEGLQGNCNQVCEYRSPENTEVKLASTTRMKLQEISRKMLAKRRKICADTQTDDPPTVRVKDTASITDSTEIETKDAEIMTELHEDCTGICGDGFPGLSVTRVKEIATLTEKFARTVRCRDVGIETEDYESEEARDNFKGDSPIQPRRHSFAETSTNTMDARLSQDNKCTASQTLKGEVLTNCQKCECHNVRECCYHVPVSCSDRNVICITLPDMLSITIESPNTLESKIAVSEGPAGFNADEKVTSDVRDGETQTDENHDDKATATDQISNFNYIMLNDISTTVATRSASCQSDGKTFRIENIFEDPKNTGKAIDRTTVSDLLPDLTEHFVNPKTSLKLTNTVGTSFTPETTERSTEIEGVNFSDQNNTGKSKDFAWRGLTNLTCGGSHSSGQSPVYNEVPDSPSPISWPISTPTNNNGSKFKKEEINGTSIPRHTVAKIEAEELKSPLLVARLISNSGIEVESNFSDDSLDPDEIGSNSVGSRLDEAPCPPDVVAHTKKDVYDLRVEEDFADEVVEFPRSSLGSENNTTRVHDYTSLVLGRNSFIPICQDSGETSRIETPESEEGRNNQFKKKVSFSNASLKDRPQANESRKPKPIIKNKLNTPSAAVDDHNLIEERGDSQSNNCEKITKLNASTPLDCSTSENSFRDDISSISESSETIRSGILLYNSDEDSDSQLIRRKREESEMKRVRFEALLLNGERGELGTSDSESCENGVSEDENHCCRETKGCELPHRIFESYLNEATAFVNNMNTMNDYVNASRLFLRQQEQDQEQDQEQKDIEEEYIEYKGCKISLKDDTEEYLKPEDFNVPVDSYNNCLRGIARLENCIEKAVHHDKILLDKYGIRLESATTSYSLVDPGKDSSNLSSSAFTEFLNPGKPFAFQNPDDLSSNEEETRPKEDLETAIFEHLMDSAGPRRRNASGKPYFRRSTRMSDLSGKLPPSYSRLRKKHWDNMGNSELLDNSKWHNIQESNSQGTIKGESEIKMPQCFLAVPDTGKSSFNKGYCRNEGCSSSSEAVGTSSESIDTVASVRNKFRYPGSPRAKLLQLVSERRQIVNRSRNASPL